MRRALSEAEEVEAAALQNAEGATERAAVCVFAHLNDWQEGVERARTKADAGFAKALSRLQEAEAARAELRGVDAWIKQLRHGGRSWLVGGVGSTGKAARGAQALRGRLDLPHPEHADSKLSVMKCSPCSTSTPRRHRLKASVAPNSAASKLSERPKSNQQRVRQMHDSAISH